MQNVLQQPQRDQYGLPLLPPHIAQEVDSDDASTDEETGLGDSMDWFKQMGVPQPSAMPTPKELRAESLQRSGSLLASYSLLHHILERHEDVLRKRWMKKTKGQRKLILLKVWPDMPLHHRPDYEAFRKETASSKAQGTKFRDAYMWPFVNIEDLVQGRALLLFINSRGRNPPPMFGHADSEAMRLGKVSGAVMPAFLNLHTMYLEGETVETYGRLVAWDDSDEAMNDCFSRLAYQPGEGLQVLEIQQRVLSFLVGCCQAILHDLDLKSESSDQAPVCLEPAPILDPSEFPSLASMAAEAPYRLPARLDFNRLKAIIAAKRSEAQHHILALREDPGYFLEIIRDWSDHRQEVLLDTQGSKHPVLDTPLFWQRVIGTAINDAYGSLVIWDILWRDLNSLTTLQRKYEDKILPGKLLPPEYVRALLAFKYLLDQASKGPIGTLKIGFIASPPIRSLFVREPQVPGSTMISCKTKKEIGGDHLMWLFNSLWTERTLFLSGLPDLMDELERLIESDSSQKQRISPWVANVVSDLGVMAKARKELDIYQPWAATFEHESVTHLAEIEKEFPSKMGQFAKVNGTLKAISSFFAKLGTPSDGRFHYPSDKRRTKLTTDQMRAAEENLDLFWRTFDQEYMKKTGTSLHMTLNLPEGFDHERTAEWIEPVKALKNKVLSGSLEEPHQSLAHLSISSNERPSLDIQASKTKTKTRGEAHSSFVEDTEAAAREPVSDAQPLFPVNNRTLKVFKTLFHTPSQTDLPGEIPWTDFLHAMVATGFIPEKLYGSVWQFTPTKLDVERSIQFHEPHPRAKIPFRWARRIGRRLNRAYGWTGDMFVLE